MLPQDRQLYDPMLFSLIYSYSIVKDSLFFSYFYNVFTYKFFDIIFIKVHQENIDSKLPTHPLFIKQKLLKMIWNIYKKRIFVGEFLQIMRF